MSSLPPVKSKKSRSSTGGGSTTSSMSSGTCWSSSSNRWSREMAKARITTSSGERIGRSVIGSETSSTKIRSIGPASACEIGTRLTMAPSARRRPPWRTGGKTPGSAELPSSAGWSGPLDRTTSSPVSRSAATTRRGTCRSRKRLAVPESSITSRRPSLRMMWSSRRRMFQARRIALPGKTRSPVRPSHTSWSRSSFLSVRSVASAAPLSAPADVPTMTSGRMPRSRRARSIPTWLTPWFPPPESTNAVVGSRASRERPDL